jgi:hypothetical protein
MQLTMKDVMTANCQISNEAMLTSNHCAALARELNAMLAPPQADSQPVTWIKPDVLATLRKDECCYAFGEQSPKGNLVPLFTRSDAGEVDRLNTVVEQQKNLIASLRAELTESYSIDGAERRNAQLSSTLEECITEMSLALQDHAVRSAMTVVGRTRFLKLVQDYNTQPAESGESA